MALDHMWNLPVFCARSPGLTGTPTSPASINCFDVDTLHVSEGMNEILQSSTLLNEDRMHASVNDGSSSS